MDDDASALQRIDPETGEILAVLDMPPGTGVSGLEFDGRRPLLCRRRADREGARRPPAAGRHDRGVSRASGARATRHSRRFAVAHG